MIHEGLRQLDNTECYQPLDEDPTNTFSGPILYIIKHATALNIIDNKMEKILFTKFSRISNFCTLQEIHKANNSGSPKA